MKENKIKKFFWEKNKSEIIIGAVSAVADVKAGIDGGLFNPDANVVGCVVFTKSNET